MRPSIFALALAWLACVHGAETPAPFWSSHEATAIGAFAAAVFRGEPVPADALKLRAGRGVVYVAAREAGDREAHAWREARTTVDALRSAVQAVADQLEPEGRSRITTLEINLAHRFRPVDPRQEPTRLAHIHRGRLGLELRVKGTFYRWAPTEMIALNLDFAEAMNRLAERAGIAAEALGTASAPLRLFEADQLLVDLLGPGVMATPLYRGNTVVRIEDLTRAAVEQTAAAQARWLWANLQPNGRMVYLYWPSRGRESTATNTVRQWMATVALGRLAAASPDPALLDRAAQNIRFNLGRYYVEDGDGHGLIEDDEDEVKLGAVGLAALALFEHPRRSLFATQEGALRKTLDALWQETGEFKTYWRPRGRMDNVNFYPGEALLYWAERYGADRDPALLDRILKSLRFYRTWHLAQRNPAFVPWHTQAYYRVWEVTRSDELRDWIFVMNDWLLEIQQWEEQQDFPDTMGRFYDPDRPFGPPHASSTGVYLEGLADAWQLARMTGEAGRQERYRRALIRGLRSLRQLTFRDQVDLFYVARRDRVLGGVRTTVYDNSIRVDNVQHGLMAMLKILDRLPAEDFRP